MRVALYAHGLTCHSNISMDFLRTKPLGGTEHVMLSWIEQMRKRGHDVSLIMDSADTENVPYYFTRQEYLEERNEGADVMVCVNFVPENLLEYKAEKRVWFVHQPGFMGAEKWMDEFDATIALSPYHKAVLQKMGWKGRMEVIGYGFDPADFPAHEYKNRKRLIYHSIPNRGLQKLIDWLPDLIAIDSEIELSICSDWGIYYDSYNKASDLTVPKDSHIVHTGAVGFDELLQQLNSAYIHSFPSTYTDETFCYAVLFSQAAGLPVVTSQAGALQDTASGQILLDWDTWAKGTYKRQFLFVIDRFLHDEDWWRYYHNQALQKAREFTWDNVIPQWEVLLGDI